MLKEKYFGVIFDHHVNFGPQISEIVNKVSRCMFQLLNHSHFVNGSDPVSLDTIFQSFVLPYFLYGSSLWIFG